MFTILYTKYEGGRAVAMATALIDGSQLRPAPTKPTNLPRQRGFSRGGRKEEDAKPRTKGKGMSYGKIGLTTVAVTQDLLSGMPLVL